MQATPQQPPAEAAKSFSPQKAHSAPQQPKKAEARPAPVELEPHLEELCDMATD